LLLLSTFLVQDPHSRHYQGEPARDWRIILPAAKFPPMLNGAIKEQIQGLFETLEPPDLGPSPRSGIKSVSELKKSLDKASGGSNAQPEQWDLIVSLVLLWHDHLDSAHELAQAIANATGSFVHGIMHRREPDYANAAYWFRRVGTHPAFPEIATRVGKVLSAKGETDLAQKLVPSGEWDPFAFIAVCEGACRASSPAAQKQMLRELQAIESAALFDWLCTQ
jgi:hypothetical protein